MRIEIAGAQVTEAVVDVLDTLQNHPEIMASYRDTIRDLCRDTILSPDDEDDVERMSRLRSLQMMLRDLETLAAPPDADGPANDIPAISL